MEIYRRARSYGHTNGSQIRHLRVWNLCEFSFQLESVDSGFWIRSSNHFVRHFPGDSHRIEERFFATLCCSNEPRRIASDEVSEVSQSNLDVRDKLLGAVASSGRSREISAATGQFSGRGSDASKPASPLADSGNGGLADFYGQRPPCLRICQRCVFASLVIRQFNAAESNAVRY